MLDLLWHLRGSVKLDSSTSNDDVLDRLERMLEKQQKPSIERGFSSMIFQDGLSGNLSGGWRATVIYDQGRFWIEQEGGTRKLRYDLRSFQAFVFVLIASMTFFFLGIAGGDLIQGLKSAAWAFGWVYGVNLLFAIIRVPSLIRRTVGAK